VDVSPSGLKNTSSIVERWLTSKVGIGSEGPSGYVIVMWEGALVLVAPSVDIRLEAGGNYFNFLSLTFPPTYL